MSVQGSWRWNHGKRLADVIGENGNDAGRHPESFFFQRHLDVPLLEGTFPGIFRTGQILLKMNTGNQHKGDQAHPCVACGGNVFDDAFP